MKTGYGRYVDHIQFFKYGLSFWLAMWFFTLCAFTLRLDYISVGNKSYIWAVHSLRRRRFVFMLDQWRSNQATTPCMCPNLTIKHSINTLVSKHFFLNFSSKRSTGVQKRSTYFHICNLVYQFCELIILNYDMQILILCRRTHDNSCKLSVTIFRKTFARNA